MSRRARLSPHFVIEEFDSRDGAHVRPRDEGGIAHLVEWWLEPMRRWFGPVTVHSGFRTIAHNAAVNGAANSVHLLRTPLPGRPRGSSTPAAAADVSCATGSPATWSAWARQHRARDPHLATSGRGGIGYYDSFVHLDTGALRDW